MSEDYERFLKSINMDQLEVSQMMASLPDPELPTCDTIYPIFSKLQGIGLASKKNYCKGDKVMTLLKSGVRQVGARYSNHSDTPNTEAVIDKKSLVAIATRNILAGDELTVCYTNNIQKSLEYMAQVGV